MQLSKFLNYLKNLLSKHRRLFIVSTAIVFLGIIYILLWHFVLVNLPQDGYFDLALRAAKLQILHKAKEYFHKTLIYNPRQPKAYLGLGRIHFEQEKYKEAIRYLDKALLSDPKLKDALLVHEIKELRRECERRYDP